jgi:hypothetical protein
MGHMKTPDTRQRQPVPRAAASYQLAANIPAEPAKVIQVPGTPNEHAMLTSPSQHAGELTMTVSPGLQAYDLTFG